jgi:hypothetical protein
MTKEAYIDLAQVIMEAAHGGDLGKTASCSSGSSKRKRPESVVTVPCARPSRADHQGRCDLQCGYAAYRIRAHPVATGEVDPCAEHGGVEGRAEGRVLATAGTGMLAVIGGD